MTLRRIFSFLFLLNILSCKTDSEILPSISKEDIQIKWPDYFPQPEYNFENNSLTKEGFYLGKKLFYDPILSKDSTISCGSCHQSFVAFAHADHKLSHGINNLQGIRNAPGLYNLIWQKSFFWDGGARHIELQPIAPIINPVEMGETIDHVVYKLRRNNAYKSLFNKAFMSDSITSQLLLKALAQFMGALISTNSKYDRYIQNPKMNPFTDDEKDGLALFENKCSSCHPAPLFTDGFFRNNGLDSTFIDSGRYRITNLPSDWGKFKVPSLRNVEVTYPYMHNGRFETLEQVLEHYNNGVLQSVTLDPLLRNGIALNNTEKRKIITFLKTLTDRDFIQDKRFSE